MSRLRQMYHINFDEYPELERAWKNTSQENLEGWEQLAQTNTLSTYAMVWSFWRIWVQQLTEPGRVNIYYVEWLYRNVKIPWPFGTKTIPTAELGKARCGHSLLAMTEENAII